MTVEPASTRANRINSDSLDCSYIGISFTVVYRIALDPIACVVSMPVGTSCSSVNGHHEIYRASKTALNMLMRSFAARHADDSRTLLLMAPGWVRTELGGPQARLSVEESIPNLANTMDAQAGTTGLQYLDYLGRKVPW
jgi:NAD(P)-dependent dehydrogenase (short-subunit alcohol dehydrogenase family)